MKEIFMFSSQNLRRFGGIVLWTALASVVVFAGCDRGKESVATDPTGEDVLGRSGDDLEDVTLDQDPFGSSGEQTDAGAIDAEDLTDSATEVDLQLEDVFFDYDSFELDATDRATLAANARALRAHPEMRVTIEGHCDERGTVQYNLALGEKRARETKRYLVSLGVSGGQLDIVSYGKERPFAVGEGDAIWSQNRRAHFVQQLPPLR